MNFQTNAPAPLDDGIYLEDWSDMVVYSRAFGGNGSKFAYENAFHKLVWVYFHIYDREISLL